MQGTRLWIKQKHSPERQVFSEDGRTDPTGENFSPLWDFRCDGVCCFIFIFLFCAIAPFPLFFIILHFKANEKHKSPFSNSPQHNAEHLEDPVLHRSIQVGDPQHHSQHFLHEEVLGLHRQDAVHARAHLLELEILAIGPSHVDGVIPDRDAELVGAGSSEQEFSLSADILSVPHLRVGEQDAQETGEHLDIQLVGPHSGPPSGKHPGFFPGSREATFPPGF